MWKNTSAQTQYGIAPGEVSLHPGPRPNGDVTIVRFTAPPNPILFTDQNLAVIYHATGQFRAGDRGRMKGSIWLRHADGRDEPAIWQVDDTADPAGAFGVSVGLASGDMLDFIVENNGNFANGNTPLDLQIHATSLDEKIALIADQLMRLTPDIVLLCEANRYFGLAVVSLNRSPPPDQPMMVANAIRMQYIETRPVTALGLIGERVNSVLSNIALGSTYRIPILRGAAETKYAMTYSMATIQGVPTHIVALRFDAWSATDNEAAHAQLAALVTTFPSNHAVIVGGDFNAPKTAGGTGSAADFDTPWHQDFARNAGMVECVPTHGFIDHIFVRGPVDIVDARLVPVPFGASDHGMPYAELRFYGPLAATVTPSGPIQVDSPLTLTIVLKEQGSGVAVPDTSVLVDGVRVGTAGVPFSYTFKARVVRTRHIDPRTHEVTWSSAYAFPTIQVVTARGYLDSVQVQFKGMAPLEPAEPL